MTIVRRPPERMQAEPQSEAAPCARWRPLCFNNVAEKVNRCINGPTVQHVQLVLFPSSLCNSQDLFGQSERFWRTSTQGIALPLMFRLLSFND